MMAKKSTILIMLSTYNGNKYIREQLDSLYSQKDVEIHILVRDDGSKDDTVEILKEYRQKYGKMTIYRDKNVGAAMSFHILMKYAYNDFSNYNYYAFSDQDDVWLDNKLSVAIKMLLGKEKALYYCNAFVTDSDLNITSVLGCESNLSIQYLLFKQPALGCTQVLTNSFFKFCVEAFEEYIKHNPMFVELHDVWTMWLSNLIGVEVIVDDTPRILYRQHDNNVTFHKKENLFYKIRRVAKRAKKHRGCGYSNMQILKTVLQDKLTPNSIEMFKRMIEYKESFIKALSFAFYMQKYFSSFAIKGMVMYRILKRLY
ncbi:glycosyltransferase [Phocaeicola sp.]|uniref:glycosyltransferase n=1 Tax=Phocaeicola sp. TaxID=2773926 RepID=UPI003A8F2430